MYGAGTLKKKPDYIIIHAITNDATHRASKEIQGDLRKLKTENTKELPN